MADEKKKITLVVSPKGEVRHTYSPEAEKITAGLGGQRTIRRASKVEPSAELSDDAIVWLALCQPAPRTVFITWPRDTVPTADAVAGLRAVLASEPAWSGLWWADMLPSGGPVLGPYADRDTALEAELAWLHDNGIPEVKEVPKTLAAIAAAAQGGPLVPAEVEAWLAGLWYLYPAVARWYEECRRRYSDEDWVTTQFGHYKRFRQDPTDFHQLHVIRAQELFPNDHRQPQTEDRPPDGRRDPQPVDQPGSDPIGG